MIKTFTRTALASSCCWLAVMTLMLQSCEKDNVDGLSGEAMEKPAPVELPDDAELFAEQWPEENDLIRYEPTDVTYSEKIYVNGESGEDSNDGASIDTPVRTLAKAQEMIDAKSNTSLEVLLYGSAEDNGTIYSGSISLKSRVEAIHIGSYGDAKARIDAKGLEAGVAITNSSNVLVTDLKITANGGGREVNGEAIDNRYGVRIVGGDNSSNKPSNIEINNVDIRDVFFFNIDDSDIPSNRNSTEWAEASDYQYGWGFHASKKLDDLRVINCNVRNISLIAYKMNSTAKGITNLLIDGCSSYETGGAGAQFSQIEGAIMRNCKSVNSGSRQDPRNWGRGSGMWLVSCIDFLFEKNLYEGAEGIGDSCGAHIDMDNQDVIIQYCLSRNNAGGFCEILGNNHNCCYRYNISINDGWRNPSDRMQFPHWSWHPDSVTGVNGCLVTINGTYASNPWSGPYNSYVYNNTIVNTGYDSRGYKNPYVFEIATTSRGVLMANNLFWIPERMHGGGGSHKVEDGLAVDEAYDFRISNGLNGDGNANVRDMTKEEIANMNIVVKNNIYKLHDALPLIANNVSTPSYWDENPIVSDPYFGNETGLEAENMIPRNAAVINLGIDITKLPSDTSVDGVKGGLVMDKDFFGNPITQPIIGACVAQ